MYLLLENAVFSVAEYYLLQRILQYCNVFSFKFTE